MFVGNGVWELGAESDQPFSFSVSEFRQMIIGPHSFEMHPGNNIYLSLDYKMSGVGSNSCGPRLAERYALAEKQIRFVFLLTCQKSSEGLRCGQGSVFTLEGTIHDIFYILIPH